MDVVLPASHVSVSIPVEEESAVGEARRFATKLARDLGFGDRDIGRVALVVSELGTNLVRHAGRGEILLRPCSLEGPSGLEILALDRGPGMANVAACLRDGYSTARSAGIGLGSVGRLSTCFEVFSVQGRGTVVLSQIDSVPSRSRTTTFEWGIVCVPKLGQEVWGDGWVIATTPGQILVMVVDGVGHGLHAFDAAQAARRDFALHTADRPEVVVLGLHEALRGTRGAVAAVVTLDLHGHRIRHAGVGNVVGSIGPLLGERTALLSTPGTLGHNAVTVAEREHGWSVEDLLLMHSDGLSNRWTSAEYPGLSRKHPSVIAGVLYRDFASRRDDVTVLVGRPRETST